MPIRLILINKPLAILHKSLERNLQDVVPNFLKVLPSREVNLTSTISSREVFAFPNPNCIFIEFSSNNCYDRHLHNSHLHNLARALFPFMHLSFLEDYLSFSINNQEITVISLIQLSIVVAFLLGCMIVGQDFLDWAFIDTW